MPYIIAIVVIIVGAIAFFALRSPVEAPAPTNPAIETEESIENELPMGSPADMPEPLVPPPGLEENDQQSEGETDPELQVSDAGSDEPVATTQTYTAGASYFTPRRTEHEMDITFTLEGTTVTDTTILYDGAPAATPNHSAFDNAYREVVIGQDINSIELSRVGGASLTSTAFNEAVAEVRAQL